MLPMRLDTLPTILKNQLTAPIAAGAWPANAELQHIVTDSRQLGKGDLFVAIKGEMFDGHDFVATAFARGACAALVAPEWLQQHKNQPWANQCLPCRDVLEAFRSLASWHRETLPFPVFGIGGSNGKTTTKELLAAALAGNEGRKVCKTYKSENGFLGLAQTIAKTATPENRKAAALVLEIGIDATGAMEQHVALFKPDVVLLTALAAEHVAGFGSSENAINEEFLLFTLGQPKLRIWNLNLPPLLEAKRLRYLDANLDLLVVPEQERANITKILQQHTQFLGSKPLRFLLWRSTDSVTTGTTLLETWEWTGAVSDLATAKLGDSYRYTFALIGAHNANNGALAIAAARGHGMTADAIAHGLTHHFEAPVQRNVYHELGGGRFLIDDTYNASPASMQSALDNLQRKEWLHRPKVLFLADMAELGPESKMWHEKLGELVSNVKPQTLLLYGDEVAATHKCLSGVAAQLIKKSEDPLSILAKLTIPTEAIILVKGSRSMKMERIVSWLQQHYAKA